MGQARDLPLHIQREAGVVGHPSESEEKWCEPRTAQRNVQAELAGELAGHRLIRIHTDLICVLKTTLWE